MPDGSATRPCGLSRIETRYYTGARHELLNETNRDEMQRDVLGWLGKMVRGECTRQYNRTASSKCQVRRISITSYSRASAGGNAW